MRASVMVALAAALICLPGVGRAQDTGPDASMNAPNRHAAERSGPRPDEPAAGPVDRGPVAGEGPHADTDCKSVAEHDTGPNSDARANLARCRKLSDADIVSAPIFEIRKITHHTATIGGKAIAYTATAGTLTIRDDEGKPTASMFYVAYTTGDTHRPVTFFYNGGPGSSTLWLHMGSLAPVRVLTDSPASTHNAPFQVVNNDSSLLDKSDLVFLDAIGAGYSRPLGDTKLAAFWGTDPDIDAFAKGIERYLSVNDRWNSPKFIFGESYGTTRSAGLSYRLQSDGVQLNGVMLLSSILNYGRRSPGFDREIVNYIPSFAAIAAYHHRLANQPTDIPAFLREVREFARGPYATALAKGQDLSDAERRDIATKLAGYIGLSPDYILAADLRIEPGRFRAELLRDQRLILGRYDARFTGSNVDAVAEDPEYDPSDTGMTGAFVSAYHDYLTRDLGYVSDLSYRPTYYSAGIQWDFTHKTRGLGNGGPPDQADVALDLSQAMRQNPHLLLYSLNGIYDLATPFFGTEYDLGHMQLPAALRGNVRFAYYPSGHMVYLNPEALKSMKADLARFYDEAAPR